MIIALSYPCNSLNITVNYRDLKIDRPYHFAASGIVVFLLLGLAQQGFSQQSDTTRTTEEIELEVQPFPQPYHSERSTDNFLLPSSGIYGVPEPTEYYTPPFMGQKHLDAAVEAYRKRLEEGLGNSLLFQFISKIAPFVNNQFEFGVYRIYDLPIVERDHPLLDPQVTNENEQESQ